MVALARMPAMKYSNPVVAIGKWNTERRLLLSAFHFPHFQTYRLPP
jgi:hypothetical protein